MSKITIDESYILKQVMKSERMQSQVAKTLASDVETAKQELLNEFDESPVTKEIQAGPQLESSQILPYGYGNLFSFLGFYEGSDPITPVRDKLSDIRINKKPQTKGNKWIFTILVPSVEDMENVSPSEWESGRSWIDMVTRGVSGFSRYIHRLTSRVGRSSGGIEANEPVRTGDYFSGTSYVIGMLGRFRRKFTK